MVQNWRVERSTARDFAVSTYLVKYSPNSFSLEIDGMELLMNKFEDTILKKSYASEEQFTTLMTMAEHDNDDKWFEGK